MPVRKSKFAVNSSFLGGLKSVFASNEETGRLSGSIFRFDPNPFQVCFQMFGY